jgi:hypothetical protein
MIDRRRLETKQEDVARSFAAGEAVFEEAVLQD